ncbi:MAG: fibronectin type III domain-containing protein [Bacteroidota bacterium]|nr:fibronectin type III domain-containing protein [Bacteroidota bacterium]
MKKIIIQLSFVLAFHFSAFCQNSISGITITNIIGNVIQVSWNPFIGPFSATGYSLLVYGKESSYPDTLYYYFQTNSTNPFTITGLMANNSYFLTMKVLTVSGISPSSSKAITWNNNLDNSYNAVESTKTTITFTTQSIFDNIPPSAPGNFTNYSIFPGTNPFLSMASIQLDFIKSNDNIGVKDYIVYLDGHPSFIQYFNKNNGQVRDTLRLNQPIESTASFSMKARDFSNNVSTLSAPLVSYIPDIYSPSFSYTTVPFLSERDTSIVLKFVPLVDVSLPITLDIYTNDLLYKSFQISDTSFSHSFKCYNVTFSDYVISNPTVYSCDYLITVNGLNPQSEYRFKFQATDAKGNSSGLKSISGIYYTTGIKDTIKPSVPQNLKIVTITSDFVSIAWNPSSDNIRVKGYEIEILETGDFYTVTGLSYTILGLISGKEYNANVRSFDSNGNKSNFAAIALIIPFKNVINNSKSFELVENKNKVYPNPANNIITLTNHAIGDHITVKNVLGDIILTKLLNSEREEIDISFIQSGIYFMEFNNLHVHKLIKQ